MMQNFVKNLGRSKYLAVSGIIVSLLLLVSVVFESNNKIITKSKVDQNSDISDDLENIKKFIFSQIKSPFININYEIKKGDTIQKILKKYKVEPNEIAKTIYEYKKYANSNNLSVGN